MSETLSGITRRSFLSSEDNVYCRIYGVREKKFCGARFALSYFSGGELSMTSSHGPGRRGVVRHENFSVGYIQRISLDSLIAW